MNRLELLEEAARLLELVAFEFKSDPMSVQCFDLNVIVKPSIEITKRLREFGNESTS